MKRTVFFLIFFSLLFLFYPGDSNFFHLFAYHRPLFTEVNKPLLFKNNPIPVLKNQSILPEVFAEGVYVVDLPSFSPVLKRNEHTQFFPASTTKIISALVARDLFKPEDVITVKETTSEGQLMNLIYGEKITVENLLYGLLVHSANDAAFALANHTGYNKFITLMNKKAKELHMNESSFTNPAGFDEPGTTTSPFDLALAGRELLKDTYLSKIVATKEIIISDIDYTLFHKLTNVNKLLGEIQGLGGLKTGYTENAGENLVSFYKKNGSQYIIVVLKSPDRFTDTTAIVQWINDNVNHIPMPSYN